MNLRSTLLGAVCLCAGLVASQAMAQAPQPPTLYQRLGGYDALAAVTDDFIGRLVVNPRLARFFSGFGTDSKTRVRQLLVDQLCNATGGPCAYIGRSMKTAHAGLGITEDDWNAAVADLVATLTKFKVPQREKDEVLAAIASMKGDIVEAAPNRPMR